MALTGDDILNTVEFEEVLRRTQAHIREAHPELSDDAVRALLWDYSYTHR